MIEGKWKLIVHDSHNRPNDKTELYDLAADPSEEHNLAESEGEVVKRMRGTLDEWWAGRPNND